MGWIVHPEASGVAVEHVDVNEVEQVFSLDFRGQLVSLQSW